MFQVLYSSNEAKLFFEIYYLSAEAQTHQVSECTKDKKDNGSQWFTIHNQLILLLFQVAKKVETTKWNSP